MSFPVALALLQLCAVGNALEVLRDAYQPVSDEWTAHTDLLGMLDEAIETLAASTGMDDTDAEDTL